MGSAISVRCDWTPGVLVLTIIERYMGSVGNQYLNDRMIPPDRQIHCIWSFIYFETECQYPDSVHVQLLMLAGLSVFLRQGTSQGCKELVHCHVDLRGEFRWEHNGHDHKDAVGKELPKEDHKHIFLNSAWVKRSVQNTKTTQKVNEVGVNNYCVHTLKLAGSTRRVKACSSLSSRSPAGRLSSLSMASVTPAMMRPPCLLTSAELGVSSSQWEK